MFKDEDYSQPCHQASASSYVEQACCVDPTNQGSQQRQSQPRPPTPLIKPKMSFRVAGESMENVLCPDKALGSSSQQIGSGTTQFAFPHPGAESQSPELCKCKKPPSETRDAATQTAGSPAAETRDASTQCRFVAEGASTAAGFNLYLPPVDVPLQQPATGRQAETAAEPNTHTAPSGNARSGVKQTPWSKKKAGATPGSHTINKFTANTRDGKVFLQRPINPFLDVVTMTDGRGTT